MFRLGHKVMTTSVHFSWSLDVGCNIQFNVDFDITQPQCSGWVIRSWRHLSTFRGPRRSFQPLPRPAWSRPLWGLRTQFSAFSVFGLPLCRLHWGSLTQGEQLLIGFNKMPHLFSLWIRKGATYIETQINVIVKNLIKKNITLSKSKKPTWAIFVPTMLKHIILLALPI